MKKPILTRNPEVLDMLKALGMPENCKGAKIEFPPDGVVTVTFEKALFTSEHETLKALLFDKVPS